MSNCKYSFGEFVNVDYQTLMEKLKESSSDLYDILYSKDLNVLERVIKKILDLKEKGKLHKRNIHRSNSFMDGSAEINISDFGLLEFIDSGLYVDEEGNPIMKIIDIDEYIDRKRLLYAANNLSKEEIEQHCNILKNSWKRISDDGCDLHKIILNMNDKTSYSEVLEATKGTSFENLSQTIYDRIEKNIYKEVRKKNGSISKEYGDDSKTHLIKNINLTSRLANLNKVLTAHIDYMIINPNGTLDIYNLKTSHEAHAFWDNAKKEKYKNEFALMARILLNNGINIKNIRFNVIPVVLEYNDTYTDVTDIHVHKAECYSHNNGAFIMYDLFRNAERFIDSNLEDINIENTSLDNISKQLGVVFPKQDIRALGIRITVDDYINHNWKYWVLGPQPDTGYNLVIDGKHYTVKDPRTKSDNEEVKELIRKHSEDLLDNYLGELSASSLINLIKQFRRIEHPNFNNYYLDLFFAPYFEHITIGEGKDKKFKYEWKILENDVLNRANVIVFLNSSGLLNIISLSNLDIYKNLKLNRNRNILGYYLSDSLATDNQGHLLLDATYGNIETMRALFILNEILPSLPQDSKLGNVSVIGGLGTDIKSLTYPIQMIMPNFVKTLDVAFKNENFKVKNNFKEFKFITPTELLINEYFDIMLSDDMKDTALGSLKPIITGSDTDAKLHLLNGEVVDSLASAETNEIRIQRIEELINKLVTILKTNKNLDINPDNIIKLALDINPNKLIRNCCRLLLNASITLDRLSGIIRISSSDVSTFDELLSRPLNIANSQIRIISKLLLDAIHNTSVKLDSKISEFNIACLEYYKAKGYTATENALIGDQVKVFLHLFRNEERELIFKNPYDTSQDLDEDDRKFLKKVLFIINSIRFLNDTFSFKDENDPKLLDFIDQKIDIYFLVPLEKASSASRWKNPISYAKDFSRRADNYCHNPLLLFKELYEKILTEEEELELNSDIKDMLAYNPFKFSDTKKGRERLFKKGYEKEFFETNLLNLVIDYVHRDIQEKEMNKMLVRARGILLYLKVTGERDNNPVKFAKAIQYIDDYLKVTVFNKSIMEKDSKLWEARLRPLRKMITKVYIAASPTAAVRDTLSGFMSNNIRALTKFRTNIDVKDVMWAYQYVLRQGVHNAMDIDILDRLNSKYLISNINIESPLEGYKTNRGGIRNASNWFYATLRKPDFLNRMVLFMAQLKHDGSNKAYNIIDNELVYDWRKDARFNLLASENKSDMVAYNKQKAEYLSLLIAFNEENPDANLEISLNTDLPDGYTLKQIDNIKNLADTIYGSYNKSTRAKYENTFIGSLFTVFSTWMNGIYDVYFGSKRESSYETQRVLKLDEYGNLLWIDENGNITTTNTGVPFYTDIPLIVQGVFGTLKDMLLAVIIPGQEGSIMSRIKAILTISSERSNIRRLISDLIMWYILHELFEKEIDPAYKEHKKNGNGKDFLENAIIEILYKGSCSSFEEFKGPIPIIDYVSNNTKPAAWLWSLRVVKDIVDLSFGDKSFEEFIFGMLAFPRSFLDSYRMFKRDTKNGLQAEKE